MSSPAVLRVQPIYEHTKSRKRTLSQTSVHNARAGGDLRHVDSSRTSLNRVLLGSGDVVKDVLSIASDYPRASKKGPIAGELILTANRKFFLNLSEPEKEKWAMDSLSWAQEEFTRSGKGIVAACHWHRDEEAEHLHVVIVPVATTTVGNQHSKKSRTAINYSAVLGKPPGGESHLPPSERRLGVKQTSYAEYMAARGHNLIRGVRNRRIVNKTPHEWRQEIGKFYETLFLKLRDMPNNDVSKEFTKNEIVSFILSKVELHTNAWSGEKQALLNKVEAIQQTLNDAAAAVGCLPAQLNQYVADIQQGLQARKWSCQKAAQEGAAIRIKEQKLQEESQKSKTKRSATGQRKTKEERRAARAARNSCPDWKIAQQHQELSWRVYEQTAIHTSNDAHP